MNRINPNCERCGGSGLVTISYGGDGYGGRCCAMADADDQPCPECEEWFDEQYNIAVAVDLDTFGYKV